MFWDIEFRLVTLFGLVGAMLAWLFVWIIVVVIRGALLRAAEETDTVTEDGRKIFKKFKRVWETLLWPGMVLIVLGWLFIIVWAGWRARTTADEPQGVLEGPPQGTLEFAPAFNSPEVAGERIKEEGRKLQKEGFEELDKWRQNFLDKRSNDDEAPDATDVDAGDAAADAGVRDSGPPGEESDSDAPERGQ